MKRCPLCQSMLPADYTHCPRDGTALISIADWAVGSLIRGKYRILEKIGDGGMATVYKATHARFKEVRALKVISAALASDASFVRRFEQEAIVTRKLQHPNAVRVDDIDEADDGRPFIVMEYVEGRSLKDAIEAEAPMALPRVCAIIEQAAGALDAAHAIGLVHRDIKPGNIALIPGHNDESNERVKILDFGIAKLKEAQIEEHKTQTRAQLTLTDTGILIGTPAYMSPEQARGMRGDQLDGRSDLYSLGIVMYQMLTGELPIKGDSTIEQLMAHINTPPQPIRVVRPDISPDVAAVVMRCLEKNRDSRPASGQALVQELKTAMSRATAIFAVPSPQPKPGTLVFSEKAEAEPAATTASSISQIPSQLEEPSRPMEEPLLVAKESRQSPRTWFWLAALVLVLLAGGVVAYIVRLHPYPHQELPAASETSESEKSEIDQKSANAAPLTPPNPPRNSELARSSADASSGGEKQISKAAPPAPPPMAQESGLAGKSGPPTATAQLEKTAAGKTLAGAAVPVDTPKQALAALNTAGGTGASRGRLSISPEIATGLLIKNVPPVYPPLARKARVEGLVQLTAQIGKDGSVENLEAISGHPMLLPAAIEAVRQWHYKPYIVNNEAVPVDTQIQLNFVLKSDPQPTEATAAAPPTASGQVYHVGGGVSAPSIISSTQPDYTDDARRARRQGNVVLSLVVDATGHARNVRVVSPLGFGLDEKAIDAVKQWRFQPGAKDGNPVNVQINIEVEFRQY